MILKNYIVEQQIGSLAKYNSVLLYGENDGIKNDLKDRLKKQNENCEIINLFQEEILKNKILLHENYYNSSLFEDKKLIFIYEATDKIFNDINEILERENKDVKIYIFSGLLEKRSKLRNLFEKETNIAIIPCYQDNERTLSNYIATELKEYKGVTQEIINIIIANANMDRRLIKNELLKIKIFFYNKPIKRDLLEEMLNIKTNSNFNQLRDAALMGSKSKINRLISETEFLDEDNYFYLNSVSYRLVKLIEARANYEENGSAEIALDQLKPKVFWKDKPIYLEQLKKWDIPKLKKALNKVGNTEILMKRNSQLRNDILIKNLLINLCCQVSTS